MRCISQISYLSTHAHVANQIPIDSYFTCLTHHANPANSFFRVDEHLSRAAFCVAGDRSDGVGWGGYIVLEVIYCLYSLHRHYKTMSFMCHHPDLLISQPAMNCWHHSQSWAQASAHATIPESGRQPGIGDDDSVYVWTTSPFPFQQKNVQENKREKEKKGWVGWD